MQEHLEKIKTIISDYLVIDSSEITLEKKFSDLGLDSIDMVELFIAIEDEFDIEIGDKDSEKIKTVGLLVDYLKTTL